MEDNTVYVKNMVCRRCILTVTEIFTRNGLSPLNVELGVVRLDRPMDKEKSA